jgi:hypothetical protein
MKNQLYENFVAKWEEVMEVPPQTVGPFTPFYKKVTKKLKVMPFPVLIMLSIGIVFGICVLIGSTITLLVSILQRGF